MKDIVIIGAGGFGREVAWLIEEINKIEHQWNILGFIDDNFAIKNKDINGYKVIGDIEWLKNQELYAVCSIGDPRTKKDIIDRLNGSKIKYPTLIHPSVMLSSKIEIGEGSIICAANILTVNITIEKHVIINLNCTVGHDVYIKGFSTILPGVNISGNVLIEKCVSIGTGSAIIQGITINENVIIGAGSVVVRDLPKNCTAIGIPAKPIKFHDEVIV